MCIYIYEIYYHIIIYIHIPATTITGDAYKPVISWFNLAYEPIQRYIYHKPKKLPIEPNKLQ